MQRKAHPEWSEPQLTAAAKASYEAASTEWLVQTLRTCRSIRPKARWGFYGYPIEVLYDVGNSSSAMVAYAERQLPVFRESGGLYPSLYLPSSTLCMPPRLTPIRASHGYYSDSLKGLSFVI